LQLGISNMYSVTRVQGATILQPNASNPQTLIVPINSQPDFFGPKVPGFVLHTPAFVENVLGEAYIFELLKDSLGQLIHYKNANNDYTLFLNSAKLEGKPARLPVGFSYQGSQLIVDANVDRSNSSDFINRLDWLTKLPYLPANFRWNIRGQVVYYGPVTTESITLPIVEGWEYNLNGQLMRSQIIPQFVIPQNQPVPMGVPYSVNPTGTVVVARENHERTQVVAPGIRNSIHNSLAPVGDNSNSSNFRPWMFGMIAGGAILLGVGFAFIHGLNSRVDESQREAIETSKANKTTFDAQNAKISDVSAKLQEQLTKVQDQKSQISGLQTKLDDLDRTLINYQRTKDAQGAQQVVDQKSQLQDQILQAQKSTQETLDQTQQILKSIGESIQSDQVKEQFESLTDKAKDLQASSDSIITQLQAFEVQMKEIGEQFKQFQGQVDKLQVDLETKVQEANKFRDKALVKFEEIKSFFSPPVEKTPKPNQ
jgi:hypothetical protein